MEDTCSSLIPLGASLLLEGGQIGIHITFSGPGGWYLALVFMLSGKTL